MFLYIVINVQEVAEEKKPKAAVLKKKEEVSVSTFWAMTNRFHCKLYLFKSK